jgi:hypothetical protein
MPDYVVQNWVSRVDNPQIGEKVDKKACLCETKQLFFVKKFSLACIFAYYKLTTNLSL